jgi:hypothetical protein
MKIQDVTVYLAKEWRTFLYVVIDTDEGIYGLGEAGLTGRELAVAGAIEHFKPLLIGQDPYRIEHIWQMLFRGGFFRRSAFSHRLSLRLTLHYGTSKVKRLVSRFMNYSVAEFGTRWSATTIMMAAQLRCSKRNQLIISNGLSHPPVNGSRPISTWKAASGVKSADSPRKSPFIRGFFRSIATLTDLRHRVVQQVFHLPDVVGQSQSHGWRSLSIASLQTWHR